MIKRLTAKDITAFDELIMKYQDSFPDIEHLDGFLCALACAPEQLPFSEILPHLTSEDFEFPNKEEATQFMGYLFSYHNAVMRELSKPINGPEDIYFPFCLKENEEGNVDGIFWANGFMHGLAINHAAWAPLLDNEDTFRIVTPMMAVSGQGHPDPKLRSETIPEEMREESLNIMFQNLNLAYACLRGELPEEESFQDSPIIPINSNENLIH